MRRLVRWSLLALVAAGTLALPGVASASHNADEHSSNMQLRAFLPEAGDLSPPAGQNASANSDFAFWDDRLYTGHYDKLRIVDISNPTSPSILSEIPCRGGQNDVSVWANRLLITSIDTPQEDDLDPNTPRGVCTQDAPLPREGTETPPAQGAFFEGIRIFDVTNPTAPHLIKGVDTDCGSHTHTLVPDLDNNRLLVYVASYPLRSGPICGPNTSDRDGDLNPLHNQISVVEIPLAAPANAHVIAEPKLHPGHPVFPGAAIGSGFNDSLGCHDIQVFLELKLAAAACMSDGELWDISDPANPNTLGAKATDRPEVEFWHSAAFSWDGKLTLFSDESVAGSCSTPDEPDGRMWLYRTSNIKNAISSFLIPRSQGAPGSTPYCTAHLFNFLPFTRDKRYVVASSWYNGGISMIDFTSPEHPVEIGYYDRVEGINEEGFWTGYWFNRRPWGNHIEQGQFVFDFLSPLTNRTMHESRLNPQTQIDVIKPLVTASAAVKGRASRRANPAKARVASKAARRAAARRLAP
jgi:hypothetical protein